MKDRAPLRNEFEAQSQRVESNKQFLDRTAQLEALQNLIIKGFNNLVGFLDGKVTKTEIINQLKEISTPDVEKVVKAVEKLDKTTLSTKLDLKPILEALKGVQNEIASIPKELPDKTESVKVDNLNEIKFDTSTLEKAIEALELKVDVKAPIINTEKVELKPLQDIMIDLLKAFNKQKLEVPKEFKINNLDEIKPTDLTRVEKKLDESNKHLKVISEKKMGGGGGGGNGTPYIDTDGKPKNVILDDGNVPVKVSEFEPTSINIVTAGVIKTITETDGVLTKTTVIDSTDPNDKDITILWS